MDQQEKSDRVSKALDSFRIEIPFLGFCRVPGRASANSCRYAAANSIDEKFADAAEIHQLTGVTPTLGLHVEWDLPEGVASVPRIRALEKKYRIALVPLTPNLFQRRSTSTGQSAIRIRKCGRRRWRTFWTAWRSPGNLDRRIFPVGFRWFELSGNAEYAAAHRTGWKRSSARCMQRCSPINGC